MSAEDETPKPGQAMSSADAELLLEALQTAFHPHFDAGLSNNIPMACRLEGVRIGGDLSDIPVNQESKAYSLYENTGEIFLTTVKAMADYLKQRQPWEDYDICIFDISLNWCIGISHEDRHVWAERSDPLSRGIR